ncbi:hypothetical protein TM239_58220 [Bradyrhizobium sp. TM239]|nr:hypothetical protein TM239_58220 [Bradyrhizobium sp. TM239]
MKVPAACVPDALQRATLLRRAGTQKLHNCSGEMGPGSAAHRKRAALRPGHCGIEASLHRPQLRLALR